MAPPLRAVVAVVAQVVAERLVAAVRPVALLAVVEGRAHLAHKLLPRVLVRGVVVLAARRVPLPAEAEVAARLLVQGLVDSRSLGSRLPFSTSTARISPSPVQLT